MWKHLRIVALMVLVPMLMGCMGQNQKTMVHLGEEFLLQIGQTAVFEGEQLQITFHEVVEDSRCPRGVTCVWEGRISVTVDINYRNSLNRLTLTQSGSTDGYIKFEEYDTVFVVEPYPEKEKNISESEYRLVLKISEESSSTPILSTAK